VASTTRESNGRTTTNRTTIKRSPAKFPLPIRLPAIGLSIESGPDTGARFEFGKVRHGGTLCRRRFFGHSADLRLFHSASPSIFLSGRAVDGVSCSSNRSFSLQSSENTESRVGAIGQSDPELPIMRVTEVAFGKCRLGQ
jgi:hypothetical protein